MGAGSERHAMKSPPYKAPSFVCSMQSNSWASQMLKNNCNFGCQNISHFPYFKELDIEALELQVLVTF